MAYDSSTRSNLVLAHGTRYHDMLPRASCVRMGAVVAHDSVADDTVGKTRECGPGGAGVSRGPSSCPVIFEVPWVPACIMMRIGEARDACK